MSSEMILLEVAPQTPINAENKLKNEFVYSLKQARCTRVHPACFFMDKNILI
jgi:hypothetical protein